MIQGGENEQILDHVMKDMREDPVLRESQSHKYYEMTREE